MLHAVRCAPLSGLVGRSSAPEDFGPVTWAPGPTSPPALTSVSVSATIPFLASHFQTRFPIAWVCSLPSLLSQLEFWLIEDRELDISKSAPTLKSRPRWSLHSMMTRQSEQEVAFYWNVGNNTCYLWKWLRIVPEGTFLKARGWRMRVVLTPLLEVFIERLLFIWRAKATSEWVFHLNFSRTLLTRVLQRSLSSDKYDMTSDVVDLMKTELIVKFFMWDL